MILREYQIEAIESVREGLASREGNPCVVLPTGAGKTVIFAEMLRQFSESTFGFRAAILAHRVELLSQTVDKISTVWPDAPIGVMSAGLGSRDTSKDICVAGIQTVASNPHALGQRDLLIIDEAHRIPFDGEGQYLSTIKAAKELNPNVKIVGFTATPWRIDGGVVFGQQSSLLNYQAYFLPPSVLAGLGYLVLPTYRSALPGSANMDGVKITAGEFNQGQAAAVIASNASVTMQDAVVRVEGRKSVVWFCASVLHAKDVTAYLRACGRVPAMVEGETRMEDRQKMIEAFKAGQITDLVNVDVLTEGFDAPNIDGIVLLRATASTSRYVQMVGRGFRPCAGKEDFLLLDYAGNIMRHGFVDQAYYPELRYKKREEEEIVRCCPVCYAVVETGVPGCVCGFEWPKATPRKEPESKLSNDPFDCEVKWVTFDPHVSKASGNESIKISYGCGAQIFNDWISVENPKIKTRSWQKMRAFGIGVPYPQTNQEALERLQNSILKPARIEVKKDGEWWRVVRQIS